MGWSITIGRIAGTAVRIHITFLLYLGWIAYANWDEGGAPAAWDATIFVSLLFLCVLAHEFGHIFAARRYGIATPDVTLLPIGGVARLERIPADPKQELVVALAGPAVNAAIALALTLFNGAPDPTHFGALENPNVSIVERLIQANIILVVFNLIPAFPMDGGRVLRALLAMWTPRARATLLAARIGQGLAFVMMLVGFMGQPMLFVLAVFIWLAAKQEAQADAAAAQLGRFVVADAMERDVAALAQEQALAPGYERLLQSPQEAFPVIDLEGRPVGLLTRAALSTVFSGDWQGRPIASLPYDRPRTIAQATPLDQAIVTLAAGEGPLLAVDSMGRLVGLLTRGAFARA